jgi:hypothetical protein
MGVAPPPGIRRALRVVAERDVEPSKSAPAGSSAPAKPVGKGRTTDPKPLPSVPLKHGKDPILEKSLELLGTQRGIVYGENHLSSATPDWVRSNLRSLKAVGVRILFVEIKNKNQPSISKFLSGKLSEKDFRSQILIGTTDGVVDLIVAAKKHSMNVVAMDVEDPTPGVKPRDPHQHRLEYANPAWAKAVNEQMAQQPGDVKYIMVAGNLHTNKAHDKYQGVDSLLGVPSIDIFDNSSAKNENKVARLIGLGPKYMIPDAAIRPEESKLVSAEADQSDFIGVVPDAAQRKSRP